MPSDYRSRFLAIVLCLFAWFSCAWFGSWERNPNNAVRLFAAISLVEDHDATIDDYQTLTIDKARFGDHYYLDKAPGMTLMSLPAIWAVDRWQKTTPGEAHIVAQSLAIDDFLRVRLRAAVATTSAVLTGIAAMLMFLLGRSLTGRDDAAAFGSIAYALGTPIWGWSTSLFSHAADSALYVVAIWAIWTGTQGPRARGRHAFLAGLALGWSVVVEYQAAIAGTAIGLWALWRLARRTETGQARALALALLGGVIAALPLVAYNVLAFGTVFKFGYAGVVGFQGMNQGLFGLTYPKPAIFAKLIVGWKRGMIWVAPIVIAAPFGLWRLRHRPTRDLSILAALGAVAVFAVNAAYVYWNGGNSIGPRLSMPALAFAGIGFAPFWAGLDRRWMKWAVAAVLGVSIAINLMAASAGIDPPETDRFPVWSYVWKARFQAAQLRTIGSEYWGWTVWQGLAFYLFVAALAAALVIGPLMPRAPVRRGG